MSHSTHSHTSHSHGFAHPTPVWQLIAVFLALILLTVLTVAQASMDFGSTELLISLVIATIKASLVIMFFMHMIHDKPINAILFIGSFIFVALFLGFTLMDAAAYNDRIELKTIAPEPAASSPVK